MREHADGFCNFGNKEKTDEFFNPLSELIPFQD